MANRCGPGSVLIVHQGEMGTGFCSSIPRYFDRYVQYIDRQPTLELTDVGEYDIEQLYTVLLGPLESGEYYNRKDLNGDGINELYKASEIDGEEQILTVYGRDDEFQKYELSYDDWLDQYGQTEDSAIRDQANQSASDLNSILGGIGNEQEISDYLYGLASGPMPEPTGTGPHVEVNVFPCLNEGGSWLDCTTLGMILQIPGIPALPSAILGTIYREKTLREIIEDIENAADTVKEVIGDIKDIFDPNVDSKLDEKIKGILTTIKDKVKGIFDGDGSGEVTIGDIDEILKGVGGAVLTGVFGVLVETGKDAIEDTLGLPPGTLLTTDKLSSDSCFAQGFQVAGDGSDKWNCSDVEIAGQPCDGPYNSTGETDEQGNCNFVAGASCQPPNEPMGTAGEIDASGNCIALGGDDDDDDDGVELSTEAELCRKTGREYDELNDICKEECENPRFSILADGNCGLDDTTTGTGYSPVCTEPRPTGELTFALQEQQMMWDQQCAATHCPTGKEYDYFPEDTNKSGSFEYDGQLYTYDPCDPFGKENSLTSTPIDDGGTETGGSCPEGSERDDPFYDSRDTDQSGTFVSNGITYSYDPCNPSSGFSIVGQNVGCSAEEEQQGKVTTANGDCVEIGSACLRSAFGQEYCPKTGYNTPYGVINSNGECECPSDEGGEKCDDPNAQNNGEVGECVCNAGFDKPQGYDFCTSIEQLCADGAQGYGPDNELCGTANGCPEGQSKFDGVNCEEACADDPTIGVSDPFCGSTTKTCNDPNAVNDGEEGDCRCKPGFVKGDDGLCFQSNIVCENGATVESGCDTCPDGTNVAEYPDGQCPAQDCSNPAYAAANPNECGTPPSSDCSDPEYAAANPEECAPAPPPETGGGGGSVGGGAGAFSPFMAGIDYTPQALPTPPAAPQKDYMMELDNLIKRSLFEGIV